MNHTGFVVSDMERALVFYRDVLGLREQRNMILEGDIVTQLTGFENAKVHVVYLGNDLRHAVELVHFLEPAVIAGSTPPRNQGGDSASGTNSRRCGCVL